MDRQPAYIGKWIALACCAIGIGLQVPLDWPDPSPFHYWGCGLVFAGCLAYVALMIAERRP